MSVYCASWCDLTVTQAQEEETRRIARQKELETRRQAAIQRKAEEDRQRAEEEERKAREAKEEIERRRKEREEAAAKREAEAEKKKGAEAYKKRELDVAETHFSRAWEVWPKDITFLTNLSGKIPPIYSQLQACLLDRDSCVL